MAKILVIDDSKLSRSMIKKELEKHGHQTAEATNGREGLTMIESYQPEILTVDLLMPEMDGIRLLTTLRIAGNQIPVIVISADIQREVRQRCEALGAIFINKPFKSEELAEALDAVLVGHEG